MREIGPDSGDGAEACLVVPCCHDLPGHQSRHPPGLWSVLPGLDGQTPYLSLKSPRIFRSVAAVGGRKWPEFTLFTISSRFQPTKEFFFFVSFHRKHTVNETRRRGGRSRGVSGGEMLQNTKKHLRDRGQRPHY